MTTAVLNTKIGEVLNSIPDVSGYLISDIEKTYFTTSDYNKFKGELIDAKMKGKGLVDKSVISNLVKEFLFKHKTCNISNKTIKSRAR